MLVRAAAELRAGEYVIYPGQGVHRVAGFERMDIAGQQLDVLKLARERDGATVIVPVDKVPSTGLRRVAERELVEDVFQLLAARGRHVELDWRERHREIGERLTGGPEARRPPEELEGVLGIEERGIEARAPGEEGAPLTEERKPERRKRAGEVSGRRRPSGRSARR